MPKSLLFLICPFVLGQTLAIAASAPIEFLRYMFGAEDVAIEETCWPNDDVWMVHGANNPAGLAEIAKLKLRHGQDEVIWELIQNSLCVVELRKGKVDPAVNLDQIQILHRQLALRFVYSALEQDKEELSRIVTNVENVRFGRVKPAAGGDMGVYGEIIARLPVLRVSTPAEDKISKSITYRVALAPKGMTLRMIKRGSQWLIDTSSRLDVPLEFFFR